MRGSQIQPAEDTPGGRMSPLSGTNTSREAHLAAYRGAHADRVPLALEGHSVCVARHLEVKRAFQPRSGSPSSTRIAGVAK